MNYLLLENKDVRNPLITELFGLSRSGKSTFAAELFKKNKFKNYVYGQGNKFGVAFNFFKFFIKKPVSTVNLFYLLNKNNLKISGLSSTQKIKIFLMKNSYLFSVLSKSEFIKLLKEEVLVDEFLMQSLLMIFQNKATKTQIEFVMKLLPQPERIILVEERKNIRYKRFREHRFPGGHISKEYSLKWMENQEYNYNLIKKILLKKCGRITFPLK